MCYFFSNNQNLTMNPNNYEEKKGPLPCLIYLFGQNDQKLTKYNFVSKN